MQNEYNLLRRRDQYDVAETCALEEIAYLAWSPLAMGVISGKYLDNNFPAKSRFSKTVMGDQWQRFQTRIALNANAATHQYVALAKQYQLDPCQMAIAFTLSQNWLKSSIIGATSISQLKTNIAAIKLTLSPEILADIDKIYQAYPVPF